MKTALRLPRALCVVALFTAVCGVAHAAYQQSVYAGPSGTSGADDGPGNVARFWRPYGTAVDASGNVYVADNHNCTIRKITAAGVVSTLAGSPGIPGSADGAGSAARFSQPFGLAVDGSGNVFVADTYNCTIRKITAAGVVTTLAGSPGVWGFANGTGSAANFNAPTGVAVDGGGNVYVTDAINCLIRKVTAAGVVTTLAGTSGVAGSADGTGSAARFNFPSGVAATAAGIVYVADSGNGTIRKVTAAGVVSTLAGSAGNYGSADGTGSAASFGDPVGVAVDAGGNVYVADTGNNSIRKITPAAAVTTLAGDWNFWSINIDGTGSEAQFYNPRGVAVDGGGNVYVADADSHTIRKVTSAGVVTTFAGCPANYGVAGRLDTV